METKKYIIEIPDNTAWLQWVKVSDKDGHVCFDFKDPEDLTLYTEPDLDAIRKEAYKDGREAGIKDGMCEAWEAARKIVHLQWDGAWAGVDEVEKWFDTYTASEAIEKIRQHEQEQEEQIAKGDVVRMKSAPEIEIFVTYADEEYVSGIALTEVDDSCEIGDQYIDIAIHKVEKTGRHYEIAEVLRKMREE